MERREMPFARVAGPARMPARPRLSAPAAESPGREVWILGAQASSLPDPYALAEATRRVLRRSRLALIASAIVAIPAPTPSGWDGALPAVQAQQRQRAGGNPERARAREPRRRRPAGTFRTEVPRRAYDIVLGNPTSSSVTASILAYEPMEGYFELGPTQGEYPSRSEYVRLQPGVPKEVVLGGLDPNARYYYRWCSRVSSEGAFGTSDQLTFRTGRAAGDRFVFTVQSDSHLDDRTDPRLYEATLRNARSAAPDFHIDLGDTFMTDKRRTDYREALPQYLAQRFYFGLIGPVSPVFLVSGNHDGEGLARGALGVWARDQRRAHFASPTDDAGDQGNYFAWEWGDALFVALDPYWKTPRVRLGGNYWARTLGERQYRWLARTLRSSRAQFKFVFTHHLVGGMNQAARGGAGAATLFEWGGRGLDGAYEFDMRRPGWGKPIHRLLVETGVSAVFHGHDHVYAREELDGIVYLLVPQPGLDRYSPPRDIRQTYAQADVVGGPGHIRVTVDPRAALVELIQTRLADIGPGIGRAVRSFDIPPRCEGECR